MKKRPFNFDIRAEADGTYEIQIRGVIGQYFDEETWTVKDTEEDVLNELKRIPVGSKINVRINSRGGDVGLGLGIYNALKTRKNDVTTHNCGYAFSAASIAMLAGSRRISTTASAWMIHRTQGGADGTADDLRTMADGLEVLDSQMAAVYAEVSGKHTKEEFLAMMKKTTWFGGAKAVEMGLATEVSGETEEPTAFTDSEIKFLAIHKNSMPRALKIKLSAEMNCAAICRECAEECDECEKAEGISTECLEACRQCATICRECAEACDAGDYSKCEQCAIECDRCRLLCDKEDAAECKICAVACQLCAECCRQNMDASASMRGNQAGSTATNNNKPTKAKSMNKIIAALVAAGFKVAADANEDQIVAVINGEVVTERDNLKAENQRHVTALTTRVTAKVEKAIADQLIKADRKDALVKAGITNESTLDFIDDLRASASERQPRGVRPAARTGNEGNDDTEGQLADLQEKMNGKGISAEERGAFASESLKLRGLDGLFKKQSVQRQN